MLMCNEPMTIDLGQEHGEPCGRGTGLPSDIRVN